MMMAFTLVLLYIGELVYKLYNSKLLLLLKKNSPITFLPITSNKLNFVFTLVVVEIYRRTEV